MSRLAQSPHRKISAGGTRGGAALWWIVGSNGNLAGIPQLFLLLFIFAIPFFLLPFAVETLLRRHGSP